MTEKRLFKARHLYKDKWIYGYFNNIYKENALKEYPFTNVILRDVKTERELADYLNDNIYFKSLCVYTYNRDNESNLIYENDLLANNEKEVYRIYWSESEKAFVLEPYCNVTNLDKPLPEIKSLRIIGNIHGNIFRNRITFTYFTPKISRDCAWSYCTDCNFLKHKDENCICRLFLNVNLKETLYEKEKKFFRCKKCKEMFYHTPNWMYG